MRPETEAARITAPLGPAGGGFGQWCRGYAAAMTERRAPAPPITKLVLLGLGDVASRLLVPAIAELHAAGELPEGFEVVGVSRHDIDDDELRRDMRDALGEHTDLDDDTIDQVVTMLSHHRADATDAEAIRPVLEGDEPVAVHVALPPTVFADAIDAIAEHGVPDGSCVVFEKPFGTDLASAVHLNERLARCFPDDRTFRVDHFLGKQTVQQILGTRFANRIIEAAWNADHIASVEVVWDETLALEGRAGFYDSTGALRDMVQNHLMQLFSLVAMEPPDSTERDDVADRKVEVLRATRPFHDRIADSFVRARYSAGEVDGESVSAYAASEGVDPERGTETFASIVLAVDTPRWRGVPFTLRSGKALAADRHEVRVRFRPAHGWDAADDDTSERDVNELRFGVGPDTVELDLVVGEGAADRTVRTTELVARLDEAELGAYAVVLRDVIEGRAERSVRGDEVEAAWAIVQPFLDAAASGAAELQEYPAGSTGP